MQHYASSGPDMFAVKSPRFIDNTIPHLTGRGLWLTRVFQQQIVAVERILRAVESTRNLYVQHFQLRFLGFSETRSQDHMVVNITSGQFVGESRGAIYVRAVQFVAQDRSKSFSKYAANSRHLIRTDHRELLPPFNREKRCNISTLI
jgi:hypothetical protein